MSRRPGGYCHRFIDADFVLVEISQAQRLVDALICNSSRFKKEQNQEAYLKRKLSIYTLKSILRIG